MKLHEVLRPTEPFAARVQDILWQNYQQDAFFPTEVEFPEQLDDEEFLDFEEHIQSIVKFAREHRINNPEQAVLAYHDDLDKKIQTSHRGTIH